MKPCILRLKKPAIGIAQKQSNGEIRARRLPWGEEEEETRARIEWENATPLGCGYLGAMLYGGVGVERIQLNEERIWSGLEEDNKPIDSEFSEKIAYLRRLLMDGKAVEADNFARENITFKRIKSYESAGEIVIDFGAQKEYEEYRRDLDLLNGVANISYVVNGYCIKRTAFASYPQKMLIMRVQSEQVKELCASIRFERENVTSQSITDGEMSITAKTQHGEHYFNLKVKVISSDGVVYADTNAISVASASEFTLFIKISSEGEVSFPQELNYEKLLKEHINDFSALMKRSDLRFGNEQDALEEVAVDERLQALKAGKLDFGIYRLLYHFGRYLLVSSSRIGTLPANLQGVWCRLLKAPWNSDYHTNINLQMNYWLAEPTNLSECHLPLFAYMNENLLRSGQHTAQFCYGCRGTVTHHLSDIYGFTMVGDGVHGLWPLGGAWLAYHMWEHYLYTGDIAFLENVAYEYIAQSARFFLDYTFEWKGVLHSGPSASPENKYLLNGKETSLSLSPTMDIQIISGLFDIYVQTEEILKKDLGQQREAIVALSKMPNIKIGKNGTIQEWFEDYEETEIGHRHISHLFGLYPACQIDKEKTPQLFEAAKKTIERRLAHGGGHTGWSAAWILLFYARLLDGAGVETALHKFVTNSVLDNLFDNHPPFQIDGNFGVTAGLAEAVLQSHNGIVRVCPALPTSVKNGCFEGLVARGGVVVSAKWQNGEVTSYELTAQRDCKFVLAVNRQKKVLAMKRGEVYHG